MHRKLSEVLPAYYATNLRISSEKTKAKYRYTLADFATFLGREPLIADLTDDNLIAFMRHVRERGAAAATTNDRRARLRALWEWCSRRGITERWPTAPKMREPRRAPRAFTVADIERILAAAGLEKRYIGPVLASLFWTTLIRVAWLSGERITAILSLQWRHTDTSTGWIYLLAEDRKGETEDKNYRIDAEACRLLERMTHPICERVFEWPYCESYLWTRFGKIIERAGLPNDRKHKFHAIRKATASYVHLAGGDATSAMGHSSADVTRRFYLDARICGQSQPVDVLPQLRASPDGNP